MIIIVFLYFYDDDSSSIPTPIVISIDIAASGLGLLRSFTVHVIAIVLHAVKFTVQYSTVCETAIQFMNCTVLHCGCKVYFAKGNLGLNLV